MLKNDLYNLVTQLAEENKSLWRIKNMYKNDAGDCPECKTFWDKLEKDKEEHIEELRTLIKTHI
jgi:hypothetical protein